MERFNVYTVAYVTGYSTGAINAWATSRGHSTKDGLSVMQVADFLNAPKHENARSKVDEKAAERLKTALEVMGAMDSDFKLEG